MTQLSNEYERTNKRCVPSDISKHAVAGLHFDCRPVGNRNAILFFSSRKVGYCSDRVLTQPSPRVRRRQSVTTRRAGISNGLPSLVSSRKSSLQCDESSMRQKLMCRAQSKRRRRRNIISAKLR